MSNDKGFAISIDDWTKNPEEFNKSIQEDLEKQKKEKEKPDFMKVIEKSNMRGATNPTIHNLSEEK